MKNQRRYNDVLLEFKRRIADDFGGLTSEQYDCLLKAFLIILKQFKDLNSNRSLQAYEAYLVFLQNVGELVKEQKFSGLRIVVKDEIENKIAEG